MKIVKPESSVHLYLCSNKLNDFVAFHTYLELINSRDKFYWQSVGFPSRDDKREDFLKSYIPEIIETYKYSVMVYNDELSLVEKFLEIYKGSVA